MKLKILFFPVTLVLSLSILIWFVKPMWTEYKTSQSELKTATNHKQELEEGLRSLNMSMDAYEIMDEDSRQLIKNAITMEKNNDDFIAEIHKNIVNSGIFLAGTKLKEERIKASAPITPEEGYVKVEKEGTLVEADVVGNYLDIKSFVEKVDVQNRFTMPKEVVISRMDEEGVSEDGETVEVSGELIKAKVSFVIYDKEVDTTAKISELSGMNDKIVKSLLTTGLKTKVVDDYRNSITSTLFKPVTASGSGKQDLFAK